jgi:hypothetical protein
MRDEYHFTALELAPAAPEFSVEFNEIDRAFIFVGPPEILDVTELGIDQNKASWTKQGAHSPVIHANVAIQEPGRLAE